MANTANKVVDYALSQVGYLEKNTGDLKYLYDKTANAGYNNYTFYGYEMHKLYPSVMDYPASWCDCFVDYCFYKVYGVSNAKKLLGGDFDDYTKNSINLYKSKNAFYLKSQTTPQPGDQIFFSKNGVFSGVYHTGLVIKVSSDTVYTVEGNTSGGSDVDPNGGGVFQKSYSLSNTKIYGYGRPPYDNEEIIKTTIGCGKDGVTILTNALNVRQEPSTSSKIVKTYKKGDKIIISEKAFNSTNPWFKSTDGWFSAKYCEGWILEDNLWWYVTNGYEYPKNEIKTINGKDYVFDKNGWMITSDRINQSGEIIY